MLGHQMMKLIAAKIVLFLLISSHQNELKKKETKTNGQFELARVSLLSFILLKFNVSWLALYNGEQWMFSMLLKS